MERIFFEPYYINLVLCQILTCIITNQEMYSIHIYSPVNTYFQ